MTLHRAPQRLLEPPAGPESGRRLGDVSVAPPEPPVPTLRLEESAGPSERPPVRPVIAAAAATLATAGAGWMLAGAFAGLLAHVVAAGAAVLGGLFVAASGFTRRSGVVQLLALPAGLLAGMLVAAPGLSGGAGSLPSQIADAIRQGGLSSPPIAFDPGWRFLLVLLVVSVTVAAATVALAFRRSQLAVVVPVPLLVAGVLMQPPGKQLLSVAVCLALIVAGLSAAYGGQLAQQGISGGTFEARRLLRAAAIGVVLVAALVGVGRLGFLLPTKQQSQVIPPRKPGTPGPITNQVLFTVKGPEDVPLRLGVLDVYADSSWMTPPYDPNRYVPLAASGTVPAKAQQDLSSDAKRISITIHVNDVEGRSLPELAGTTAVSGYSGAISFDPRTQTLQTNGRIAPGSTYTVTGAAPPTGAELSKSGSSAGDAGLAPFQQAPPAPYAVQDLLLKMPANLTEYQRLAYLREKYYSAAVAAGPGNPVSVPPQRVADILAGKPASPYEIAAGEVLLARWAGIPARLGYGYFGGTAQQDGTRAIRPKDGAMWLEAYFKGFGWVPILGRPQHAQPSLTANPKNSANIKATDLLGASVYLPVQLADVRALYTLVQYWVVRLLPWVAGLALLWFAFPGLVKLARRQLRVGWARHRGPAERMLVEYAELRDYANDLNVGHPTMTPIEFLDAVAPDEAHTELAWLVSRALWGDLARDLRPEDARHATTMARSVRRRLFAGQPIVMRLLAFASAVSLRSPYTSDVPNLWAGASDQVGANGSTERSRYRSLHRLRTRLRSRRHRPRRPLRRRLRLRRPHVRTPGLASVLRVGGRLATVGGVAALAAWLVLTGGIEQVDLSVTGAQIAAADRALPKVPDALAGVSFERDASAEQGFAQHASNSLVSTGRFYSIRHDDAVVATLQMGVFKPGLRSRGGEVRDGLLNSLGAGDFSVSHINDEQLYVQRLTEVVMIVWFDPDAHYYELMTAKNGFDTADEVFVNLLNYQRTGSTEQIKVFTGVPPLDVRRGAP